MQFKRLTIFLVVALVLLWPGSWLNAAYNTFQTNSDVTVNISDLSIDLTVLTGAKVEQMVVNTGNVTLTMQSGSTITFQSADRREFSVSGAANASHGCPSSGASNVTITSSASETVVVTPQTTTCTAPSGSSGGGGGGGVPAPAVVTPSSPTISVNTGAAETSSSDVTLSLSATNANQMMLSNLSTFAGAAWETYATTKSWTLTSGVGKKTVYVKYKSSSDLTTSVVSDDITVVTSLAAKSVTKSAGGTVELADKSASVDVPAGALSGDGIISITPTASYAATPSGKGLVGSQVYNMKAEVNAASVTSFAKELSVTFTYTAEQIKNMDESTLAIYYYDETASKWVKIGGTVDKTKKTVTVKTNHFTKFAVFGDTAYSSGDLVKLKCDGTNASICTAVYYLGNDGKRYVFPNSKTYATWYDDFSTVKTISASGLASYMIGGNVNYRPGIKMVKIDTDPKVYAVAKNGELRWVKTETMANALYGNDWNKKIDDIPDAFFFSYTIGKEIASASDYSVAAAKASATTINMSKGL